MSFVVLFNEQDSNTMIWKAPFWKKLIYYGTMPLWLIFYLIVKIGFILYFFVEELGDKIVSTFRLDFWILWYFQKDFRKGIDSYHYMRIKMIWGKMIGDGLETTLKGYFTKKVWILVNKQYELNGKPNGNDVPLTSKY